MINPTNDLLQYSKDWLEEKTFPQWKMIDKVGTCQVIS